MKKFLDEFKEFAVQGNAIQMAVGVVIGAAFGAIVTSLVRDIIMPFIGILTGSVSFAALKWVIGNTEIPYGMFIQSSFDFILTAMAIFMMIRVMNKLTKPKLVVEEPEPEDTEEVALLKSILKELQNKK